METLKYQIEVNASAEKIWDVLWNEKTYAQWTHYFSPGSRMSTDWQVGGKTYFTDADGQNGMVSTIDSFHAPYEIIFKHLGELRDGVEDLKSEKVREWTGSLEAYHLEENAGKTRLTVSVDVDNSYKPMMDQGFNKGLEVVKKLSENH